MAASAARALPLAALSLLSFLFAFGTAAEFVRFVSFSAVFRNVSGGLPRPEPEKASPEWKTALQDPRVLRPLAVNLGLIVMFVLQHSLMASSVVKQWMVACFGVLQRSFYIFCTSLTLQMLMRYWQPVKHGPFLWNACTEPWGTWISLICFILHFLAWLVICSIVLIFDYAELMGLKQVYYYCLDLGDPLALKSPRAVRLYSHLRHPVYLEFLLILWAVPCFPLDRLLLAGLLTLYLTCGHGLDQQDYVYLRSQLDKKFLIFSREETSYGHGFLQNGAGRSSLQADG
ncbi:nurim isoform X2 [Rhinatrema bivittatum]|uniref:nurim isoform X2 n=1 Tax=Rhinatrema bivittatum TaxID=194408 RepID=UPI00112B6C5D|nr:nurim isoform X2 [Rhinatrema bivittatum]